MGKDARRMGMSLLALAAYGAGVLFLLLPYRGQLVGWTRLLPVSMLLGAQGVWVLAGRWLPPGPARGLTGALYGAGPLMIYLARFHPLTVGLAAVIPWSLCPAAYGPRRLSSRPGLRAPLSLLASLLPALVLILFCQAAAHTHHFPAPLYGQGLTWADVPGACFPLIWVETRRALLGCCHAPLAALLVGTGLLVRTRRWGVLLLALGTGLLAALPPRAEVSPVLWLTVTQVVVAVTAGLGVEVLACAGPADRAWTLAAALALGVLAAVALVGGADGSRPAWRWTATLYAAGGMTVALGLAAGCLGRWAPPVRRWLLVGVMGADLLWSAQRLLSGVL